jgi:gamma-glutamylcyclotransferase (GGCT)/AIG2-like uncharacterized protein YtfP
MAEAGPVLEDLVAAVAPGWLRRRTLVPLFVNGGGMRGGNVHHTIADQRFLGAAHSAARYRFHSVRDEFPGMEEVAEGGVAVPGELYLVDLDVIRTRFVPAEPAELELGVVELEDGSSALAVVVRRGLDRGVLRDISGAGGWRAYRDLEELP